jgi:hypothetical protein
MATPSNTENQSSRFSVGAADIKEVLHKELDLIQSIISRMASNSFQCKGWMIGILSFLLAFNKDTFFGNPLLVLGLLFPIFIFWYLDGFFLYTEQRYRDLYQDTVKKRLGDNPEKYYDLNYTRFEDDRVFNKGFWTHLKYAWSEELPIISAKKTPPAKEIQSIGKAMFSKTLKPFYYLPIGLIFFIAALGYLRPTAFESKESTQKISIIQDSTSTYNGKMMIDIQTNNQKMLEDLSKQVKELKAKIDSTKD